MSNQVGVIGAGSFGMAIASLISHNADVFVYTRNRDFAQQINQQKKFQDFTVADNITLISEIDTFCNSCRLIFPIVPSEVFRDVMRQFSPLLNPSHFLIHATKGLDIRLDEISGNNKFFTMSQIIQQETNVTRIGALSGPNLSKEIMQGDPAATVIASSYDEVIEKGKSVLRSNKFQVYGSHDVKGVELCGALKNIIAIASGILSGVGFGKNAWAFLVSRGLSEMISIGVALGADVKAFLGVAGIGDLIATASSTNSRNFTLGSRIGKGEPLEEIINSSKELAEGYYTIKVVQQLIDEHQLKTPIVTLVYKVLYEGLDVEKGISMLMSFKHSEDVQFI